MKAKGTQFNVERLPKVGDFREDRYWDAPEVPEGHTRLYRFTNGVGTGHYADTPLPAYGNDMWYSDVPNTDLEQHRRGENRTFLLTNDSGVRIRKADLRSKP